MASHREILKANRRARRKIFFRRSVIAAILVILTLLFSTWYFWNSPFFALTSISIVGSEKISIEQITVAVNSVLAGQYFKLFQRKVNWFYPRAELLATLKQQFPELTVIKITNFSMGTLQIDVEKRQEAALWCQEEDCYFIDNTGLLYASAPQFSNTALFTLTGLTLPIPIGSRPLSIPNFQQLLKFRTIINQLLQKVPDFSSQIITTVSLKEPIDYVFEIRNVQSQFHGWQLLVVRLNSTDVITARLMATFSAPAFLDEYHLTTMTLQSLDLRFKRRVFYKFM